MLYSWLSPGENGSTQAIVYLNLTQEFPKDANKLHEQVDQIPVVPVFQSILVTPGRISYYL